MPDEAILKRLDRIIAILSLAHYESIENARQTVRADPVNAAVLDALEDWTRSGALQQSVVGQTGSNARTVRRRIAALIAQGAVEQRGAGNAIEYRASGLI